MSSTAGKLEENPLGRAYRGGEPFKSLAGRYEKMGTHLRTVSPFILRFQGVLLEPGMGL